MANILFKRGLKASLGSTSIVDGTVYVTTDERAMYVDVGSSRIRLGDFKEYATFEALQALNTNQLDTQALYYITSGNMLIKWTGDPTDEHGGWVQINSPATLANLIGSIKTSASSITGGASLTETFRDDHNNIVSSPSANFTSANTDLLKITPSHDANGNYGILTFTPASIVENAAISVADGQTSGTAVLTITNNKTGTDANGTAISTTGTSSTLTIAGNGIMVEEDNGQLLLTNSGGVTAVSQSFNAQGKLTTNISLNTGDTVSNSTNGYITPTITYGQNGASSAVFASGTAALSVYTQSEVDTKISNELKAINAMTFKGTIGTNASDTAIDLPTTNVKIGDVYKLSSNGNYGGQQSCHIGDMFIATGTEGTDGYISGTITWSYIPSGDDDLAQFTLSYNSTTQKIELLDNADNAVSTIAAGNDITFGVVSGHNLSISHSNVTRTNTNGTAQSSTVGSNFVFSAITGITTSATGHITGVETTQFTVLDTFRGIQSFAPSVGTLAGTGENTKITLTITDTQESFTSDIKLHSDSLTFARDTANAITSIDLTWGSF